MKWAMLVLFVACAPPPKMPVEADPEDEPMVVLNCKLEVDLKPEIVLERCGPPYSKMYTPDYDDAVVWRYCGKKADGGYWECHETFGLVFFEAKLFRWGRVYEVVQ